MTVVAILNPKGGSGKTSLSTNLARALHDRGNSVLFVDSDPQGSARDWQCIAEDNPLPLVALDRPNTLNGLSKVNKPYDFTVIDGGSKLENMLAMGVKVADAVLIPVQPSPYDIWAAEELVEMIKTRQTVAGDKPYTAFVITKAIKHTKLSQEIISALDNYEIPVFKQVIMQRQAYPQTASVGQSVMDSANAVAISEINALADELIAFIEGEGSTDGSERRSA